MGGIVVEHRMDLVLLRALALYGAQEGNKVIAGVTFAALADDRSAGDIKGGEKRSGAMAIIVVTAALWLAGTHR